MSWCSLLAAKLVSRCCFPCRRVCSYYDLVSQGVFVSYKFSNISVSFYVNSLQFGPLESLPKILAFATLKMMHVFLQHSFASYNSWYMLRIEMWGIPDFKAMFFCLGFSLFWLLIYLFIYLVTSLSLNLPIHPSKLTHWSSNLDIHIHSPCSETPHDGFMLLCQKIFQSQLQHKYIYIYRYYLLFFVKYWGMVSHQKSWYFTCTMHYVPFAVISWLKSSYGFPFMPLFCHLLLVIICLSSIIYLKNTRLSLIANFGMQAENCYLVAMG